jgi:RND family efflux transporter MFP subunit
MAGQPLAQVEHKELIWQARSAAAGLQAAQAGLKVAQANVDGVKLEFDRTKALFDGGSATQAQMDGAKIHLDAATAQAAAAQAQVAQAEAGKGLLDQQLANSRIDSPITGVITKKNVNVGTSVGPQSPAFTVQDVATLKLESSVQADDYPHIARGMPVAIHVDAYPGETFKGKLDVVSPTLDAQSRRAAVEIAIDNHNGRLLPHMFAHAAVTIGHVDGAVVVPRDSVLEAPGGAIIFRVKNGHVEALRPKLGSEDEGFIPVLDGLAAGDEVALGGLGSLSDGAAVRVSVALTSKD